MDKENKSTKQASYIKESGNKTREMDLESSPLVQHKNIKAHSKKASKVAVGANLLKMEINIKANTCWGKFNEKWMYSS